MKEARHTAAQAIGKVGALDLGVKQWPELLPALKAGVQPTSPAGTKQATLEALGYVCEELDPSALEQVQVNEVLTAVVAGMRGNEDAATRVVATKALDNALNFAAKNFETEVERTYLMTVLCEGAHASEEQARGTSSAPPVLAASAPQLSLLPLLRWRLPASLRRHTHCCCGSVIVAAVISLHCSRILLLMQVREACMECLADVAFLYYPVLGQYVKTVFEITQRAFSGPLASEKVAIHALDFWANVCEHEAGEEPDGITNFGFALSAAPALVPLLLTALPTKVASEDELEDDTWDVSRAAGLCLQVLCRTCGNMVVDAVLPFVQLHVTGADWRAREAAVTAFGALVDGPSDDRIRPVAAAALNSLLTLLKDPSLPVRRSTAHCLGTVFEALHMPADPDALPPVVPADTLPAVLSALVHAVAQDDPSVADSAIWAVTQLVDGYSPMAAEHPTQATPLSPFFTNLVQALLQAAERPDAVKLRGDAYDALCETLNCGTAAEGQVMLQLIPHLLAKLAQTWEGAQQAQLSGAALEAQAEMQGHLCGCLMVITARLSKLGPPHSEALTAQADHLMGAYLRVFGCRDATVHGEALLAVGALVDALGRGFLKYMPALSPILDLALKNTAEASVCANGVMLVGDLCRELETDILPYADNIMLLLLTALSSNDVSRAVKPHIISAFGDMALAVGPAFERFFVHVSAMLAQAAAHTAGQARQAIAQDDDDLRDYNNQLRAAILEAYTGIFQGMAGDPAKAAQLLRPTAPAVAEFVAICAADGTADDAVLCAAVGVLGDLAGLEGIAQQVVHHHQLQALISQCLPSDSDAVRDAADFAHTALQAAVHKQ